MYLISNTFRYKVLTWVERGLTWRLSGSRRVFLFPPVLSMWSCYQDAKWFTPRVEIDLALGVFSPKCPSPPFEMLWTAAVWQTDRHVPPTWPRCTLMALLHGLISVCSAAGGREGRGKFRCQRTKSWSIIPFCSFVSPFHLPLLSYKEIVSFTRNSIQGKKIYIWEDPRLTAQTMPDYHLHTKGDFGELNQPILYIIWKNAQSAMCVNSTS